MSTESVSSQPNKKLQRRRICLVTYDLVGPIRNGGIGTANTALAETLAAEGHDVTILYMAGTYTEVGTLGDHIARYGNLGINLIPLPDEGLSLMNFVDEGRRSHRAYQWLRTQSFDIIHFHEWRAPGFHTVTAKKLGLAFENTVLCVVTHSPRMWHRLHNCELVDSVADLSIDFMERKSVANADVLLSPSQYLFDWMRKEGWELPTRRLVIQNILLQASLPKPGLIHSINELVFFGRLEPRKGLLLFLDAIDSLVRQGQRGFQVTFLGKESNFGGHSAGQYIKDRSKRWGLPTSLVTNRDANGAQEYLGQPGRLAVIASLVENSPYTVLECLGNGIPFVASDVGGIHELISPLDHQETLFSPDVPALVRLLANRLAKGHRPAACAVSIEETRQQWLDFHRNLIIPVGKSAQMEMALRKELPLVSVCLVHYNRPQLLAQALDSLRSQDYQHFEVVLVDDGSPEAKAQEFLSSLEPEFLLRGWQLIRQENRYPGAARNNAVRHSKGQYILFMDDDNVAKPHELSTLVAIAEHSGADILTCFMDCFKGVEAPGVDNAPTHVWGPLGGATAVGFFENTFGDTNALLRKQVFEALGGFTEHYGVGHEDWEFFARAVLKGYRLEAVPESLFFYRLQNDSITSRTTLAQNLLRNLQPYIDQAAPWQRQVLLLAHGQYRLLTDPQQTHQPAVRDSEVLRIKDFVYNSLLPYPRVLNVMRRTVHAVTRLTSQET